MTIYTKDVYIIPEPHGRLIDADAVIKQLHKIANCYIDNDRMEESSGTVRAMLEVKDTPTVIEGSE